MFVTPAFVFLHQPKTGGTFVAAILTRIHEARGDRVETLHLEPAQDLAGPGPGCAWKLMIGARHQHGRRADIPPSLCDRRVVATIRNPYDRYASQFEFAWWRRFPEMFGPVEDIRRRHPTYPDISFEEFVRLTNTVSVPFCPARAAGPIGFHTYQFIESFARHPEAAWQAVCAGDSSGWREETSGIEFLDQARLNDDLHGFLLRMGYAPGEVAFVREADRIFPPEGGRTPEQPWQRYFTPALKAEVRRGERLLFERFPEFDV